ncbi:hypothetical protein BDV12DRAFT_195552 [Aspergillus spectabilis]
MSFAPPPGPPPPSVPEGWTTQFDDTYKQWFFINLATGRSQWDPPQSPPAPTPPTPAQAPVSASEQPHNKQAAAAPPPSYDESGPGNPIAVASAEDSEKKNANLFSLNNPYNAESASTSATGPSGSGEPNSKGPVESDAELAARLQAEENARSGAGTPGAAANYYGGDHTPHSPIPSSTGDRDKGKEKKKGFFSKLMSKASASGAGQGYSSRPGFAPPRPHHHQQGPVGYAPQGGYGAPSPGPGYGGQGGYYPQQHGYGPGPGYGPGYGPQPGYGYPQQGYYGGGMQPQRRRGGGSGMGMAGAAALGVGGGLIGGALLADAIDDDHDHDDYGGGDYGGGDDFGGDF